jgi:hypothetical protein
MRKELTAVIVVVLVVATFGVGYYSGNSARSTQTGSAQTAQTSTSISEASASSLSTTGIVYTTSVSNPPFGGCYGQGSPGSNSTIPSEYTSAYYNFTGQFKSGQWNGTSFELAGYTFKAVGYTGTPQNYHYAQVGIGDTQEVLNEVVLEVSDGQTSQNMTFMNIATPFPLWPPDFPQDPVGVFNTYVVAQWFFTCDKQVFLGVSVIAPSVVRGGN